MAFGIPVKPSKVGELGTGSGLEPEEPWSTVDGLEFQGLGSRVWSLGFIFVYSPP